MIKKYNRCTATCVTYRTFLMIFPVDLYHVDVLSWRSILFVKCFSGSWLICLARRPISVLT